VRGHAEILGPFFPSALAERLGLDVSDVAMAVGQLESEGLLLRGRFTPRGTHVREGQRDGEEGEQEACDRRLLARIHRYTLDRLRSEIEPVSAQDFVRYLFDRHHLSTRTRAGGRAGLREAIAMLQGFELGAAGWEKDVLAPRVAGYRPEWLDESCLAGDVAWARLSLRKSPLPASSGGVARAAVAGTTALTSRVTPITLAFRADLDWLLEAVRGGTLDAPPPQESQADDTGAVLAVLRRRGALFLDDIAKATGLSGASLTAALWELVGRGLATGDGFQPLRELLASGHAARKRRHAVKGRWSLLASAQPEGTPVDELADRVAAQLLARYGVVFRELMARESFTVPWRHVVRALRSREARGLVRGGRFVAGFIGEQYALPEVVDGLRRVRRQERSGDIVRLRAADPLNLVGIVLPGPRVPSHLSHQRASLVFRDGAFLGADDADELQNEARTAVDKTSSTATMATPI